MIKKKIKKEVIAKKHISIRKKISGSPERPRLSVYRSNKHIYAQLIDDVKGITLAAAGTSEPVLKEKFRHGGNIEAAKEVGKIVAQRAKEAGIETVVFDRGGFVYHGRVAALAESAREAGLLF